MDRIFGEYINADHLQYAAHALIDSQGLIDFRAEGDTRSHGDHEVNADHDPDLGLHRFLAQAEESFYSQVLLNPLEEELDLPAGLVDLGHDQHVDLEVVSGEDQKLSCLRIQEAYSAQVVGEVRLGPQSIEANRLVGPQAGGLVHGSRLPNVEAHVGLRSGDEGSLSPMNASQPIEIDVSTIHYVKGPCLESDPVLRVDFVDLPLGNNHKLGDGAAQVDHGVQLDRGFPLPEAGPGKETHAQVYRGSVDGVDDLVDLRHVSVRGVQLPRLADENLGELEIDSPVPMLVGIGETGSGHRSAYAHRVEQSGLGLKAGLDVSQAFPESELGEGHAKELVSRREAPVRSPHGITGHASLKLLSVDYVANLS